MYVNLNTIDTNYAFRQHLTICPCNLGQQKNYHANKLNEWTRSGISEITLSYMVRF